MSAQQTSPMSVVERRMQATNQHDLDAFVGCFAVDYHSEQPQHPDRTFVGNEQVRKNWAALFQSIPDLQVNLVAATVVGDTVWTESEWRGTRTDGSIFHLRGVILEQIQDNKIIAARLYVDPVETQGAGIDATVRRQTNQDAPKS